ncbi:sigma-70 family RNA polymerase sigma factor [Bradyrhizobium sp. LHD-71]|uniref:sigma-70 family RNA polymerase sigma factor n=1 Tax=Bradyrhizobium sp. LHD-71 TaxID=3072141 RepID=UPI00280DF7A1|nr:sigma-70 family RNA polymerase sigma factor [Bradyrhizobium sp. LHD-71]MDQ8732270.1 sigma-70 family RNA polymerase sigma factor [Bradyrhizobium sp. LHD-71]
MTDKARFERLTLPHMDAAYNLASHLLQTRADAEDAVQDAFVRAYRAFHQFEGADIRPWLLTIVRNVCFRRLQERRRADNVVSLDEVSSRSTGAAFEADMASADRSPEQTAIASSDQALLAHAMAELPPVFREVIVLREIEDLSYREIAGVIGTPVGTVMSRLARARTELKAILNRMTNQDDRNAM